MVKVRESSADALGDMINLDFAKPGTKPPAPVAKKAK
jgi:hypothetical protein